jgi:predicted O-methyltransferase YrrM
VTETPAGALRTYRVEGEEQGRLTLYDDGRYEFHRNDSSRVPGSWHLLHGSLLAFDHYLHTADSGRTYFSYRMKLSIEETLDALPWSNCHPSFQKRAERAYFVPKVSGRDQGIFEILPAHGTVAELGVFAGAFARTILDRAQPAKLHLIDCWESAIEPWPSYEVQLEHSRQVCAMFEEERRDGRVEIHKGDDLEILASMPDHTFDWVYIDTSHQYEQTLRELIACRAKVRPGGFICGHDYADTTISRRYGFGVIRAVDEFVDRHGWEYVCLTREAEATYVLRRNSGG